MHTSDNDDLYSLFLRLQDLEALEFAACQEIMRADLNAADKPYLQPLVMPIARHLLAKVLAFGLSFDAIAPIPTGGNAWAKAFVALLRDQGREVPLLPVQKHEAYAFKIDRSLPNGSRILMVDDTYKRGNTAVSMIGTLDESGYKAVGLVSPVVVGKWGETGWAQKRKEPLITLFNPNFIRTVVEAGKLFPNTPRR